METSSADWSKGELAVPLEGALVLLEPLTPEHADGLWAAAQAPEIWRWLAPLGSDRELFDRWFELSLSARSEGVEGVFATRGRRSGELVGSTRYLNVRPADRVVEVGWTWLAPPAWRTGINVEQKLLLLRHAFERLGCVRVELKTDARNERSRTAMAALPAQFEGVLRNHMTVPDVGLRDSAYYSVIDSEWPAVEANLKLRRPVLDRDQVERQQHGGDREDRGEDDVGGRLRQPGREEGLAEQAVDEVPDPLGDEVADDLDRGEDEEDQPEVVADQVGAAAQGAAHRPSLELDHRPGEAEPDEDEDAGDEEQHAGRRSRRRRRRCRPRSAASSRGAGRLRRSTAASRARGG